MFDVKVTVITEVVQTDGTKTTITWNSSTATPPALITRVAHREIERFADNTREALQPYFGEIDPKWRKKNAN